MSVQEGDNMCPDFDGVFCSFQVSLKVTLGFVIAKEDTNLSWEENVSFGAQIIAHDFSWPNLKRTVYEYGV